MYELWLHIVFKKTKKELKRKKLLLSKITPSLLPLRGNIVAFKRKFDIQIYKIYRFNQDLKAEFPGEITSLL